MKIKKLEVAGFKSFVDPTVMHFDHGVTGIVGPNGCGKSNVVDAIRWVMGEQSAKNLRGKAMEDVIFNGSEGRGPHSFAEVALTFDNGDGLTPPEYQNYAEIKVTRRLDRQGQSDYFINGTPVRLLDVTNLFLGTGVGKRAYSIIEQGRIGYIVSSKASDRRVLIEEAAGVTRFKSRKRAAERKMEQTRQNLQRVQDILREIERSLTSLKRQAQKAERYRRYREEQRGHELHVAVHRWLELYGQQRVLHDDMTEADAQVREHQGVLESREVELEAKKVGLDTHAKEVDGAQARAYELDHAVRLLETELQHKADRVEQLTLEEAQDREELQRLEDQGKALELEMSEIRASLVDREQHEQDAANVLQRELASLEALTARLQELERAHGQQRDRQGETQARLARAEAVLQGIEKRRQDGVERRGQIESDVFELSKRCDDIDMQERAHRSRMAGLREGRSSGEQQRQDLADALERAQASLATAEVALQQLKDRHSERRSRLHSLREIQQRFEDVGQGVRALMTGDGSEAADGPSFEALGLISDRAQCDEQLASALGAALGELAHAVVVSDPSATRAAITHLKCHSLGRATVVAREPNGHGGPGSSTAGLGELPSLLCEVDGVVGSLVDLVHLGIAESDRALFSRLLGHVWVVRDGDVVPGLVARFGERVHGVVWVTLGGDVHRPDGSVTGGSGEDVAAERLRAQAELRSLSLEVEDLGRELEERRETHRRCREEVEGLQGKLEAARKASHEVEISLLSAEKDLKRLEEQRVQFMEQRTKLEDQAKAVQRDLVSVDSEETGARSEMSQAQGAVEAAAVAVRAAEEKLSEHRDMVERKSAAATEVKVTAAQAKERAERDRASLSQLERSRDELRERGARVTEHRDECARQREVLVEGVGRGRAELGDTVKAAVDANGVLAAKREAYEALRIDVGVSEEAVKEVRTAVAAVHDTFNRLRLRERELALSIEHLMDQVQERYHVSVLHVLNDYHAREEPDSEVHGRIQELAGLIERMGEINLTAIEEFDEQSSRFEQLSTQREDLEGALQRLETAIRQMNRESRRLFSEAFEAVNERFKKTFPAMFGGGRAELRLTDPNDLLETGVEIMAEPPGKRLGSLELMSGGEKALTAVSLIFAIFQYKPSPFCLLDEVDAPLDEANVVRFCEAIRDMTDRSQFILITHSKRTMEAADVLYGVTMETPGVSKLVSVELKRRRERQARRASGSPAPGDTDRVAVA